jgi:hypothetical protein
MDMMMARRARTRGGPEQFGYEQALVPGQTVLAVR